MGMPDEKNHDSDVAAIREIVAQSIPLKRHIAHHFRNSLGTILLAVELGRLSDIYEAANHMVGDLEELGL